MPMSLGGRNQFTQLPESAVRWAVSQEARFATSTN
jgi:hypothetical protein